MVVRDSDLGEVVRVFYRLVVGGDGYFRLYFSIGELGSRVGECGCGGSFEDFL